MEVAIFERLDSLQTFPNTQIGYKPALAYSEFDKFSIVGFSTQTSRTCVSMSKYLYKLL